MSIIPIPIETTALSFITGKVYNSASILTYFTYRERLASVYSVL